MIEGCPELAQTPKVASNDGNVWAMLGISECFNCGPSRAGTFSPLTNLLPACCEAGAQFNRRLQPDSCGRIVHTVMARFRALFNPDRLDGARSDKEYGLRFSSI